MFFCCRLPRHYRLGAVCSSSSQTPQPAESHPITGGSLEGRSCQGAQYPRHAGRRCIGAGSSTGKIKKELWNNHFVFSSAEHSLSGINKQHQSCLDTLAFPFIYSRALFWVNSQAQAGSAQSLAGFRSPQWETHPSVRCWERTHPAGAGLCVWQRNKAPRNIQHFSSGSSSLNIN